MTATTAPSAAATAAAAPAIRTQQDVILSAPVRRTLAVLRYATGFIFLWAFLDKTFGLGFSTPSENAWINGGKPSQGFLNSPMVIGPFKDLFNGMASSATDVLFMLGMLGIGLAVMLGIGTRVAAIAGSLIMAMMWLAEWPIGAAGSNPVVDYHVIYAIALILFAFSYAGETWGLGKWWSNLPIVRNNQWLR
ncbi:DoxX family protein [Cellulomonas sp. NPDC089187]|uniref:DoxX family protein n=1 Tax=Cellulomonas sp. NPDC089187 TaxID=3154970 RepID=UPI00343CEBF3